MLDSSGDGWNGSTYTVTDSSGNVVATGGLMTGFIGVDTLCLPDGCYDITVGGGSWESEVSWTLGDLSGGAPYEGQIGDCGDVADVPGCTDESALNYNADATVDDGSCEYESVDCDYELLTLSMLDSYGDGWNDNILTIGDAVFTLETGSEGTATVCVDMSVCNSITVVGGSNVFHFETLERSTPINPKRATIFSERLIVAGQSDSDSTVAYSTRLKPYDFTGASAGTIAVSYTHLTLPTKRIV